MTHRSMTLEDREEQHVQGVSHPHGLDVSVCLSLHLSLTAGHAQISRCLLMQ